MDKKGVHNRGTTVACFVAAVTGVDVYMSVRVLTAAPLVMHIELNAVIALSVALNVLLFLGIPSRTPVKEDDVLLAQERHTLTCAQRNKPVPKLAVGTPVSPSPLSRGLSVGPHPVTLADILVLVPAASHAEAERVWGAWGDLLQPTASLETVLLSPGAGDSGDSRPTTRSAEYGKSGLVVREVVWPGTESSSGAALARKMRRHLAWIAAQAQAGNPHYSTRRWFVKATPSTFMIPRHLLALLSWHNSTQPVYLGRDVAVDVNGGGGGGGGGGTPKGSCKRYASGVLYALSRPAIDKLGERFALVGEDAAAWNAEDMMVGCELAYAGVQLNSTGDMIWHKRLWHRQTEAGKAAANSPLVAVHHTDEATMLDFRALTNIEFDFGTPIAIE